MRLEASEKTTLAYSWKLILSRNMIPKLTHTMLDRLLYILLPLEIPNKVSAPSDIDKE